MIMTDEQKYKRKVRASGSWKRFRNYMKKIRKIDAVTEKPLRAGWQLHHCDLDVNHYENFDPENFECLNKKSHDMIHWITRYEDTDKILMNIKRIVDKMKLLNNDEEKTNEQ